MKTARLLSLVSLVLTFAACSGNKKLELGGSCALNSDCAEGLLCKFGACHKACVKSVDCATGERCVQVDGVAVCQLAAEAACGVNFACPAPLACRQLDNTCRNQCATTDDCLGAQTCSGTLCVDSVELAPTPGLDGGVADGPAMRDTSPAGADATRATPDAAGKADTPGKVGDTAGQSPDAANDASILEPGLVAHYPFNGNAKDESGHANNGTVNGAILAADRFGQAGRAYSFNGTGAYINVPDSASLDLTTAGTLMFWFNARSLTREYYALVGKSDDGVNVLMNYQAFLSNRAPANMPVLELMAGDGKDFHQNSFNPLIVARWYHVAFTFDGKTIALFVDGKLIGSDMQKLAPAANNKPLQMGAWAAGTGGCYFDGLLDDVRIYNRALSAAEVESFYGEGGWPAI